MKILNGCVNLKTNNTFNTSLPSFILQPPPEAHQLYDAVMLYAYGLNKTLSKGHSVTNGSDIIQNILNTRHESKLLNFNFNSEIPNPSKAVYVYMSECFTTGKGSVFARSLLQTTKMSLGFTSPQNDNSCKTYSHFSCVLVILLE